MTLIVGFNSPGLGLMIADSQESVEAYKYSVLKIKPESIGPFQFTIAGSGNAEAIDTFLEQFKRALKSSKIKDISRFRDLFESKLKPSLRKLRRNGDEEGMEFMVAAQKKGEFGIWRCTSETLIPLDYKTPYLMGFVSHLYQHMANTLYSETLSANQRILIGLRVLDFASETSRYVKSPYAGVVVGKYGIHELDELLLGKLAESLSEFSVSLDRLTLACSDTSIGSEEFSRKLDEFKEHADKLRGEYLQIIGSIDFMKIIKNGSGYGIPLTPSGTSMTADLDPKTGKMRPVVITKYLGNEPSKS